MKWMLGDMGNGEEIVGDNELGGVAGGLVAFFGFSRLTSSRMRSTVKLIDSRPIVVSKL